MVHVILKKWTYISGPSFGLCIYFLSINFSNSKRLNLFTLLQFLVISLLFLKNLSYAVVQHEAWSVCWEILCLCGYWYKGWGWGEGDICLCYKITALVLIRLTQIHVGNSIIWMLKPKIAIILYLFYIFIICWCYYRSTRGPDSIPAAKPQDWNKYLKAELYRLCAAYPERHKRDSCSQLWSRWSLILEAYDNIRTTLLSSAPVMEKTNLQFPEISQKKTYKHGMVIIIPMFSTDKRWQLLLELMEGFNIKSK